MLYSAAAAMIICSAGCALVFNGRFYKKKGLYQLNGTSSAQVTLISDSPDVRRLPAEEGEPHPEIDESTARKYCPGADPIAT